MAAVDPRLPVKVETIETRVAAFREQPRFLARLVASFAVFAILLAAVGLYGGLSFLVAQQTQEIGVRMARHLGPQTQAKQILEQFSGCNSGFRCRPCSALPMSLTCDNRRL